MIVLNQGKWRKVLSRLLHNEWGRLRGCSGGSPSVSLTISFQTALMCCNVCVILTCKLRGGENKKWEKMHFCTFCSSYQTAGDLKAQSVVQMSTKGSPYHWNWSIYLQLWSAGKSKCLFKASEVYWDCMPEKVCFHSISSAWTPTAPFPEHSWNTE